ncbi:MAG: glycosyltransferase [Planctomycetota bacterium]|nr:hypothetical protein [Planctomycetota bacterium]MDW8373099.1 glycosyltransferase [Planctomycetota bacterium]
MSIPKIIHYCWFGGGPWSELIQRCVASWRQMLPDYEIRRWDESNAPVQDPPLAEALAWKKYGLASDYLRGWALMRFGGIYLDVDVEVIRSFDPLLDDEAFIGFQEERAGGHWVNAAVMGPGGPLAGSRVGAALSSRALLQSEAIDRPDAGDDAAVRGRSAALRPADRAGGAYLSSTGILSVSCDRALHARVYHAGNRRHSSLEQRLGSWSTDIALGQVALSLAPLVRRDPLFFVSKPQPPFMI